MPSSLIRSDDNRVIILWCAQARIICSLKDQVNFWNRLTFLSKHLIFLQSLKKLNLCVDSVKNSYCRSFRLLETVSGCRAFSHSVFEELHFQLISVLRVLTFILKCAFKTFKSSPHVFSVVKIGLLVNFVILSLRSLILSCMSNLRPFVIVS